MTGNEPLSSTAKIDQIDPLSGNLSDEDGEKLTKTISGEDEAGTNKGNVVKAITVIKEPVILSDEILIVRASSFLKLLTSQWPWFHTTALPLRDKRENKSSKENYFCINILPFFSMFFFKSKFKFRLKFQQLCNNSFHHLKPYL